MLVPPNPGPPRKWWLKQRAVVVPILVAVVVFPLLLFRTFLD